MIKEKNLSILKKKAIFTTRNIALVISLFAVVFIQQLVYATTPLVKLFFDTGYVLQTIEQATDSTNTYTVKVLNSDSKPVTGADVLWELDNQTAAIINPNQSRPTNGQGISTVQLQVSEDSSATLTAVLNGQRQPFEVTGKKTYMFQRELTLKNNRALSNGVDAVAATATLVDSASGTFSRGGIVKWSLKEIEDEEAKEGEEEKKPRKKAQAVLSNQTSISNKDGQAAVSVFSNTEGFVKLIATLENGVDSNPIEIELEFRSKNYQLGLSGLQSVTQYSDDNSSTVINVTAMVNSETPRKVFWQLQDEDNTGATIKEKNPERRGTQTTNTVEIRSSKPGQVGVIATVYNSNKPNEIERQKIYIKFIRTYKLQPLTLLNDKSSAEANGIDEITIKARVLSENGMGYAGANIIWQLLDNSANAFLSQNLTTTDPQGDASVNITASQFGTATIKATLANATNQTPQTRKIDFVKNYNVGLADLTVDKVVARASNKGRITATATVIASSGLGPKPNQEVVWSFEDDEVKATPSTDRSFTGQDGKATVAIAGQSEGSVTIIATVANDSTPPQKESLRLKAYFKSKAGITEIKPDKVGNADGADTVSVTAKVINENGEALENQRIAWSMENSDTTEAHFINLPSEKITKSSNLGLATAQIKATNPGEVVVIATIVGQPQGNAILRKQADTTVKFIQNLGLQPLRANVQGAIEANNETNLTVTANLSGMAQAENKVYQKVRWSFNNKGTDAQAINLLPQNISLTNEQGQAIIKIKASKPGTSTITAELIDLINNNQPDLQTKQQLDLVFKQSANELKFNVTTETPVVGETVRVTLTAADSTGSPFADAPVTWSDNDLIRLRTNEGGKTDSKGTAWAEYRSDFAGVFTVNASVAGFETNVPTTGTSNEIEFQEYALHQILPENNSTNVATGENGITITAVLKTVSQHDKKTRPIKDKSLIASWLDNTREKPEINFPDGNTSNDKGEIKLKLTASNPTYNTLQLSTKQESATRNNRGTMSREYIFQAPQLINNVLLEADEKTAANYMRVLANDKDTVRVTLTATDEFNNVLQGAPVKWKAASNAIEVNASKSTTDSKGQAWIEYKASATGIASIEATVGSIHGSKEISRNLEQGIDFYHYTLVVDRFNVAERTGKPITLTATVQGDFERNANIPLFIPDIPIEIIMGKTNQSRTVDISPPSQTRTNSKGQIIYTINSSVPRNEEHITLRIQGDGVKKGTVEKVYNRQIAIFFESISMSMISEDSRKSKEAKSAKNPAIIKAHLEGDEKDLKGKEVLWSVISESKPEMSVSFKNGPNTNVTGKIAEQLVTANRRGTTKVKAIIKLLDTVIGSAEREIEFTQIPSIIKLNTREFPQDTAGKCEEPKIYITLTDSDGEPIADETLQIVQTSQIIKDSGYPLNRTRVTNVNGQTNLNVTTWAARMDPNTEEKRNVKITAGNASEEYTFTFKYKDGQSC